MPKMVGNPASRGVTHSAQPLSPGGELGPDQPTDPPNFKKKPLNLTPGTKEKINHALLANLTRISCPCSQLAHSF